MKSSVNTFPKNADAEVVKISVGLFDAIYTRQSVDRIDSISVESQAEYCKKEVFDGAYRIYEDRGYSGKNMERPAFQELLGDITTGKVRRVIVYRLDRISRSVLDFAGVIDIFQKYHVDFVSTMEKFDTGTPIGKAMLMIVMIFAQLERETIQQRVMDAYASRSRRGFYMGGRIPFGFGLQETVMDGVRTKMYVKVEEEAGIVEKIFAMYAEPQTSLGDVMRYLEKNGIRNRGGKPFQRSRLRDMITNPIYVRADLRLYDFFREHGANIANIPEDFIGINAAYLYSGNDASLQRKSGSPAGHTLVLAPHEGLVDAGTWICCRAKCMNNRTAAKPVKARTTWLAGKIKCACCGYALTAKVRHCKTKSDNRYYLCSRKYSGGCSFSSLDADSVDAMVLGEMRKKLAEFRYLSGWEQRNRDLQIVKQKERIGEIDEEIASLLHKIPSANATVMTYINNRITALDAEKRALLACIAKDGFGGHDDSERISGYMEYWDVLSISDKITVVDCLIENIHADEHSLTIRWKI
ncbi:MAG: recombinase family protein [Clostridia bacterium]|nr:recombinase family protein [Clostridia bacterium]